MHLKPCLGSEFLAPSAHPSGLCLSSCRYCWLGSEVQDPVGSLQARPTRADCLLGVSETCCTLFLSFGFLNQASSPGIELEGLGRSRFDATSLRLACSCVCVILKQFLSRLHCAPSADPAHLPPSVISVLINLSKNQIKLIALQAEFLCMYLSAAFQKWLKEEFLYELLCPVKIIFGSCLNGLFPSCACF